MTIISWSDIPGTDTECVTIVGFVVKTRSNNLLSLVELLMGTFGYVNEGLLSGSVWTTGVYVSYFP